jgi:acyl transferase domain-containing protein/protein-L-isoaspartate O-methyltransferase
MTRPAPTDHRERLQNALLAIQKLQARVGEMERAAAEPVAIVGLACRFPGGADTPEAFWRLLRDGVDAVTEIPPSRFPVDEHFDADPDAPGKTYSRWGGFVGDVDLFDPHFFGISPREAAAIDPQHRLLLEVGWEALERAGIAPGSLAGSRTGVFVGITGSDYAHLVRAAGADGLNAYSATGSTSAFVAGRLSYLLGLQGPSVAVDTACSSSLAAVHLACQSLRGGDCDTALAGGVNLMLTPEMWITTSKNRMLSPSGRCRTFDAAADGFVRGEGCGVVVLKRLSRALEDGDTVLALIRGSAMNQDGASSGITVPNRHAQEAAIRAALAAAGVRPHEVGYVEAHGTGTSLGDPIEMRALGAVLGEGRAAGAPFAVGSVKTNIGHLEAASGIAGLIRAVLMLRHGEIPPHLHLREPTPHVPWDEIPAVIRTERTPWEPGDRPRIAGVSSFGASGTNVHLVVAEAPVVEERGARSEERGKREEGRGIGSTLNSQLPTLNSAAERPLHLLPLSARSPAELRALAARFREHLAGSDAPLADVCHTAAVGRTHFAHRVAVIGATGAEVAERLGAFVEGRDVAGVVAGEARPGDPPKVAFLFTGQGAQYVGMGRQLWETEPRFRATLERCDALLRPHLERPLLSVLFPAAGEEDEAARLLEQTAYTQPALFALEYALADLWQHWGIRPHALLGHSVGEYVAACAAGVFTLEEALELVAHRGRLMQALPAGGAMAAVRTDAEHARRVIGRFPRTLSLAAINGPRSVVLSGTAAELERVVEELRAEGVDCKRLAVSHAFHSPLLDPALDALEAAASRVALQAPKLRLVSNLTGDVAGAEVTYPGYWRRHAREPVQFARGIRTLEELGCDILLEIGPAPVLLGMAEECLAPELAPSTGSSIPQSAVVRSAERSVIRNPQSTLLPSLRRGRDEWSEMLGSLARLFAAGAPVDWKAFDRGRGRRRVWLPTYPFARSRYWIDTTAPALRPATAPDAHPLLGARLRTAGSQRIWEARLAADRPGWLRDHRVRGAILLPAAAYVEMAVAAGTELTGSEVGEVSDLVLHEPLAIPETGDVLTQVIATPALDGSVRIEVFSQTEDPDGWRLHSRAIVAAARPDAPQASASSLPEFDTSGGHLVDAAEHYATMAGRGLEFGPAFRGVERVLRREREAVAEAELPSALLGGAEGYRLHPVLLDACLQAVAAALDAPDNTTFLPLGFARLRLHARLAGRVRSHAAIRPAPRGADTLTADLRVHDVQGNLLLEVEALALRRLPAAAEATDAEMDRWLYDVVWEPSPLAGEDASPAGLRPLDELLRPAAAHASALAGSPDAERLRVLRPGLDRLCTAFIVGALRELGWEAEPGTAIVPDDLRARLGVAGRYSRLFARLLEILGEDGVLARSDDGWQVASAPASDASRELLAELRRLVPEAGAELSILQRCGTALAEALQGRVDPLELLFPGGSLDEAERMYRDSPLTREVNRLAASTVAALLDARADGRPLRVLEIGAGTGGTTAHLLPLLPADRAEYTFTDVSPHFVDRALKRFGEYRFVRGASLDIARDPAAQGFADGGFDLILAANVLHATPDLGATLGHVRRLLAPGGQVVLVEGVTRNRFADLTVGLTDGWWGFADDVRRGYALIGRDRWLALLREHGLEAAGIRPDAPFDDQAVMVGRAARAALRPEERGTWLLVGEDGPVAAALSARFEARGDRCERLQPSALTGRISLPAAPRDVIYLHALDDDLPHPHADRPADALDEAQRRVTGGALHLIQALVAAGASTRLVLVTRGARALLAGEPVDPSHATLWGLGRAIGVEHPELHPVLLDLDPAGGAELVDAIVGEVEADRAEDQVAVRDGTRYAARLVRRPSAPPAETALPIPDAAPYRLDSAGPKVLDSLAFRPLDRRAPGAGEVEVEVHVTGLNFRDVLIALGQYPEPDAPLGGEFAGVITRVGAGVNGVAPGDVVLGIGQGAFSSHVTTRAELVARKPAGLTLPQAATVPSAFLTAHHALLDLAALRPGESVLVHAGAGGVGMAAIQVARHVGAEVFATAGTPAKRELLASLGVRHVFDSRSTGFADEILRATGGRGVDVVLNSLADEFVPHSFDALAEGGRFVELGKRGIWDAKQAARVRPDARYSVVDLAAASLREPTLIRDLLARVVTGIEAGSLEPLPVRSFPACATAAAFRHMAQARHTGKIAVVHPRTAAVRDDASYLITGGLGGVGLSVARWLVERGARHLVLVGRSAPSDAALGTIRELESDGARVVVVQADVSRTDDVDRLFATVDRELPPLRGVFHGALVLDDGALAQQDWSRFRRVFDPRVRGGWLLHRHTAGRPLDFFVLFSAAGSLLGSAGQANYTAANAFLDALAHHRRGLGLPALSIQWGVWSDVGRAAELGFGERARQRGIGSMTARQALAALDAVMRRADEAPQVAVMQVDWAAFLAAEPGAARSPFFAALAAESRQQRDSGAPAAAVLAPAPPRRLREELAAAPPARRVRLLADHVRAQVGRVLGLDAAHPLDPRQPLQELGLDSLMAVELRTLLGAGLELPRALPATLAFDYPSIEAIAAFLDREVFGAGPGVPVDGPAQVDPTDVAELSDDEAELLLLAELDALRGDVAAETRGR